MLLVLFLGSFVLFAFIFLRMAMLYDSDSYYHLAVARLYSIHGPAAGVPWARFSLLRSGADKELLFHILLIPFVAFGDAAVGGRLALALLNALLLTLIANYGVRAASWKGLLIAPWLWIAAIPFTFRVARLRPELLALIVILLAIDAALKRRPVLLGLCVFAFTLGYTAFHVLLVLVIVWCWRDRLMIYSAFAGVLAGLFLRPHPLANLQLWYVQNVEFFRYFRLLDAGNEILPPTARTFLLATPFALALGMVLILWLRTRSKPPASEFFRNSLIAATVFALLFLRYARMATYAFPLALIALYARTRRVSLIVLAASAAVAVPLARDPHLWALFRPDVVTEADLELFGRSVPPGAHVVADWGSGELYAFWAPQGTYLNVLEPLFMVRPFPEQYRELRLISAGLEPDVPTAARKVLDSDYLAFDSSDASADLLERTRSDPRFHVRYGGYNVLFQLINDPRIAYVRASPQRCVSMPFDSVHEAYDFAPYGSATLDGRPFQGTKAILGRGATVQLEAGRHRIITCPDRSAGQNGFYLVKRSLLRLAGTGG